MREKMKKLNLLYKIKSFFLGESGVVEKVQEYPIDNKKDVSTNGYSLKDNFGNLPQFVTYRNPLGELKTGYAIEERVKVKSPIDGYIYAFKYKTYKVGDKFP